MITGRNILCISSIDWDFLWQGHQEIMSRLATAGNRILFVENTGVRKPRLRDLKRLQHRVENRRRSRKGIREERPGLFVFAPVVLPLPYSRPARWVNRAVMRRALGGWMRSVDFRNPIVWTFLPTPLVHDLIQQVDASLAIYYCIDDFASSSHEARRIRQSEDRMFREADLVFVTSEGIEQRASRFSSRVHVFPFGVNFEAFERVRLSADEPPVELRGLPRPIVGYVGGLHQFIDQSLVGAVAEAMPTASIVLVGPEQVDVSGLRRFPNIHVLGSKPHSELPHYIKAFDVALVPYRLSDYTANVYPTKLNEYLALGVPVVSTDLHEVRRFVDRHGPVVAVAADTGTFVESVRAASREQDAALAARRIDVARENGWTARLDAMSALVERALDSWRLRG